MTKVSPIPLGKLFSPFLKTTFNSLDNLAFIGNSSLFLLTASDLIFILVIETNLATLVGDWVDPFLITTSVLPVINNLSALQLTVYFNKDVFVLVSIVVPQILNNDKQYLGLLGRTIWINLVSLIYSIYSSSFISISKRNIWS